MDILVIDIGTTSTKGIVYDDKFRRKQEYRISSAPEYIDDVHVEENPSVWAKAVTEICSRISGETNIDAISLTSQRSSVFPADKDGNPLAKAMMWQDRRTAPLCRKFSLHEKMIYEKTGLLVSPVYGAPKMAWFRRCRPEVYKDTYKFFTVADYVIHLLTGEWVTDLTYGNRSLLMNLYTKKWDKELLELFEVEEGKLLDLAEPGSLCGKITPSFAALTGIKAGIPVYTAGGDQQAAALGLGLLNQGTAEITHGTGSYLLFHAERPILDYAKKVTCNVSAMPGTYIAEIAVMTTGAVYDWFVKQFYREEGASYTKINKEAAAAGPFANGVVMLPTFQGSGFPGWNINAKGVFLNLALNTTRGDMARAVLEGIAAQLCTGINELEQLYGGVHEIALSGGLSTIDIFNQLQANIYEKKVFVYQNAEATSIGAWMQAVVSAGIFKSCRDAFQTVKQHNKQTIYSPDIALLGDYRMWKKHSQKLGKILEEADTYSMFYDMERSNIE